jgi:hypothetical protein
VPVADARKFAAAIASHELLIVEGGDHLFSSYAAMLQALPRVASFVREAVGG